MKKVIIWLPVGTLLFHCATNYGEIYDPFSLLGIVFFHGCNQLPKNVDIIYYIIKMFKAIDYINIYMKNKSKENRLTHKKRKYKTKRLKYII